jgi:ribonuclease HI
MLSTLAASLGYTGLGQRPKPRSKVSRGRSYWLMRRVQLMPRPKFKKFPTEASAKAFLNTDRSAPYSLPTRTHGASASASSSASRSSEAGPSKRFHSPLTSVDPSLLPPHLKAIADAGYTFSMDHRLVVYTDGSGLNNGKHHARAGLGVHWGTGGEAAKRNLSERVPGVLQTNNRGELLVSICSAAAYSQSVIRAIELCPHPSLPLEIRTDSQYTIGCECYEYGAYRRHDYLPRQVDADRFRHGN